MKVPYLKIDSWLEARPGVAEDIEPLVALIRRDADRLRTYMPEMVDALGSVEDVRAHFQRMVELAAADKLLEWNLFANGAVCGGVRLRDIDRRSSKASLAYFLSAEHEGRGIASRGVRAVLEYGFNEMILNRIELTCATSNASSYRLAERLGFQREGLLRQSERLGDSFVDHYAYGLLRKEFLAAEASERKPA